MAEDPYDVAKEPCGLMLVRLRRMTISRCRMTISRCLDEQPCNLAKEAVI